MRHEEGPNKRILLATDFSRPATCAYAYALRLSSVLKARLTLLHVFKAPPGFEASTCRSQAPLRTKALLELGRMVRIAEDSGVTVTHKLMMGAPETAIVEVADDIQAGLIAMGTYGRTGWDRLQLGSTAESVLRSAPCPVLTVHASIATDVPLRARRIRLARMLVAMDFSTGAEAALRYAAMLAHRLEARMSLVHAVLSSGSPKPLIGPLPKSLRNKVVRQVQAMGVSSGADPIVLDGISAPGDPLEVILQQAQSAKADLIVMGTHGRRHLERLALGSVAESVVRRAGCPVIVVPAGAVAPSQ